MDGSTAYVANSNLEGSGNGSVTPIDFATGTPGAAIPYGGNPRNVAITPDGTTAFVASPDGVTPINVAANTAGNAIPITGLDLAITPDQAPTAAFSVMTAQAGEASSFDGSASFSPVGSVTTYQWNFGDGQSATTTSPLTTHTYAKAGRFTASLTVTDSIGTSLTTEVFTGQTVSQEGGAQAQSNQSVTISPVPTVSPAPTSTSTPLLSVPVDVSAPSLSGTAKAGDTLTCDPGTWTKAPSQFAYQWSRDGTPIQGATSAAYSVRTVDEQLTLACTVTASNAAGSGQPANSHGLTPSVPKVNGCPAASGELARTKLGLAKLGMTRAQARHAYTHSSTRGYK